MEYLDAVKCALILLAVLSAPAMKATSLVAMV